MTKKSCNPPCNPTCIPFSSLRYSGYSTVTRANETLTQSMTLTSDTDLPAPSMIAAGSSIAAGSTLPSSTLFTAGFVFPENFIVTDPNGLTLNNTELAAGSTIVVNTTTTAFVPTATPFQVPAGSVYRPSVATGSIYQVPNGTTYPAGQPLISPFIATSPVVVNTTFVMPTGFVTGAASTWPDGVTVGSYTTAAVGTLHNNPLLAGTLVQTGFTIPAGSIPTTDWVISDFRTTNANNLFPAGTVFPVGSTIYIDGLTGTGSSSFVSAAPFQTQFNDVTLPQGTVIAAGSQILTAPSSTAASVPVTLSTLLEVPDDLYITGVAHLAAGSILAPRSMISFHTVVPANQRQEPLITGPPPVFYKQ